MSDFELTKKHPYLSLMDELWGISCEKIKILKCTINHNNIPLYQNSNPNWHIMVTCPIMFKMLYQGVICPVMHKMITPKIEKPCNAQDGYTQEFTSPVMHKKLHQGLEIYNEVN